MALLASAAGCKTGYRNSKPISGGPLFADLPNQGVPVAPDKGPIAGKDGIPPVSADEWSNYKHDTGIFKGYTVHFNLDSAAINDSEKAKVLAVAEYLKAHADERLQVDGYCDERGTAEYNRELGDRRALVLREELAHLGIDPMHVKTVSWGFEKPVDAGHNEVAWSQNRRGQWVLLTPPEK